MIDWQKMENWFKDIGDIIEFFKQMNSISFENIACTQVRIDGEIYELPYRINSVLDFPEILIFHSYPKNIDTQESQAKFDFEGKFSLYALSKKIKK